MANHVVHYFPRTDLRNSHMGLELLAKKAGHKVSELEAGEFLVFLNAAKTAFKVLCSNNIVAHYRSPSGYVDLRALQYLPAAFNGGKFNFDRALLLVLTKDLKRKTRSAP